MCRADGEEDGKRAQARDRRHERVRNTFEDSNDTEVIAPMPHMTRSRNLTVLLFMLYASIDEPDALSKQQECRKQIAE